MLIVESLQAFISGQQEAVSMLLRPYVAESSFRDAAREGAHHDDGVAAPGIASVGSDSELLLRRLCARRPRLTTRASVMASVES